MKRFKNICIFFWFILHLFLGSFSGHTERLYVRPVKFVCTMKIDLWKRTDFVRHNNPSNRPGRRRHNQWTKIHQMTAWESWPLFDRQEIDIIFFFSHCLAQNMEIENDFITQMHVNVWTDFDAIEFILCYWQRNLFGRREY